MWGRFSANLGGTPGGGGMRRVPRTSGSDCIYTEIADARRSDFIYTGIDVPPDPEPQRPGLFARIFTPKSKDADSSSMASSTDDEEDEEVDEDFEEPQPISFNQMAELLEANSKNLEKTLDKKLGEKMDPIAKRIDDLERRVLQIENDIDEKADAAVAESMGRAGLELDKMEKRIKGLEEAINSEVTTSRSQGPT